MSRALHAMPNQRRGGGHIHGIFAVTALSLACVAGCDRQSGAMPPPPPPAVTVAHPVEREVADWDEYTGRLEASQSVEVRAHVSGFIDSADFVEGSVVKAGDPLFVIDPRPFAAEVNRAKADVARAQAQLQFAADEYKRLESIRGGAATEREFLNARYNKSAAEAAVASAKAALEAADLNLGYTRVTALIAGRVGRKLVTPGNLITGGGTAGPATLLTTITALDPIYCLFDPDERAILRYQRLARENKRQSAREERLNVDLALADEVGFPHRGYIDFVNNRLEPGTGTLQVRATFQNPDGLFTPGLFARLRVPGGAPYPATLVAEEAIGSDQAQRFVMVVGADNVVQYRPVTVGALFEGMRVVQGVRPDERVIVNGLQRSRPGAPVNPKLEPMPSRPAAAAATQPVTSQPATTQPAINRAASTQTAAMSEARRQ
jgi:RND family efflux transporter MFP subunit